MVFLEEQIQETLKQRKQGKVSNIAKQKVIWTMYKLMKIPSICLQFASKSDTLKFQAFCCIVVRINVWNSVEVHTYKISIEEIEVYFVREDSKSRIKNRLYSSLNRRSWNFSSHLFTSLLVVSYDTTLCWGEGARGLTVNAPYPSRVHLRSCAQNWRKRFPVWFLHGRHCIPRWKLCMSFRSFFYIRFLYFKKLHKMQNASDLFINIRRISQSYQLINFSFFYPETYEKPYKKVTEC